MKNICILNYTGAQSHLGCLSASYILENELRRRLGKDCVFEYVHSTSQSVACRIPKGEDEFDAVVKDVMASEEFMLVMERADLVVLNGEGTLHWPVNNKRSWAWLASVEAIKQCFNTPVWVLNTSLFSEDSLFLSFCSRTLRHADHIGARDTASYELMKKIGLSNVVQASDLTFLVPSRLDDNVAKHIEECWSFWKKNGDKCKIIIAGSSAITSETRSHWFNLYSGIIESLAGQQEKISLLFVAQSGMGSDSAIGEELADRYDCVKCLESDITPAEALWIMRQADLIISGRFHVNTFAIAAGTPVLMLPGNTPKNEVLAKITCSSSYCFSKCDHLEDVVLAIKKMLEGEKEYDDRINVFKSLRDLALSNFPEGEVFGACCDLVDMQEFIRQVEFVGFSRQLRKCIEMDVLAQQKENLEIRLQKSRNGVHHAVVRLAQEKDVLNREQSILNKEKAVLEVRCELAEKRLWELQVSKTYRYALFGYRIYYHVKHPLILFKKVLKAISGSKEEQKYMPPPSLKTVFHDAKLKVLHVALSPLAGAPVRMCRLLDTSNDISALSVCPRNWYPDGRIFDYDIVYDPTMASISDNEKMERLIQEADIVHFHNEAYFTRLGVFLNVPDDKPVCVQWHTGPDDIAVRLGMSVETAKQWQDVPVLVIAQKHVRYYQNAIPVPNVVDIRLPEYQCVERNSDVIEICFSPSEDARPHSRLCGDKGNERIIDALKTIGKRHRDKVKIHIVTGMPLDECLAIKRRCHICIDDIRTGGFHINSLEGLALGCVVVANLDSEMEDFLANYAGCSKNELPWYKADDENIIDRLEALIADKSLLNELGGKSRRWMEQYWNHAFAINKMTEAYDEVMNKWRQGVCRKEQQARHMDLVSDQFDLMESRDDNAGAVVVWEDKVVLSTLPLGKLRNSSSGDCFLVGTGPSVNGIDFSRLKEKTCMGVNGAIAKFKEVGLEPAYYAVSTHDFFSNRFEMVRSALASNTTCFFPFWGINEICRHDPTLLLSSRICLINELNKRFGVPEMGFEEFDRNMQLDPDLIFHEKVRRRDVVGFSTDLQKGYFNGENILYTALQIAYYMGYRRFFILGMDLDYSGPNPRFYETVEDQRPTWLNESYERSIVPCFEIVRDMCKEKRMEVYNVSPKSRLPSEIIPKISFSEAIELSSA